MGLESLKTNEEARPPQFLALPRIANIVQLVIENVIPVRQHALAELDAALRRITREIDCRYSP